MALHFAGRAPPEVPVYKATAHWTWFDYAHLLSRFLFSLPFLYGVLRSLSDLDAAVQALIDVGVPPSFALPTVLCAIAVATLGSALFVAGVDPFGVLLLLALLAPLTALNDLAPLLTASGKWSDARVHAAVFDLLRNVAMGAALFVLYALTQQVEWLETERKDDIRKALEAFYAKQDAAAGKVTKAAPTDERKEPKKVK